MRAFLVLAHVGRLRSQRQQFVRTDTRRHPRENLWHLGRHVHHVVVHVNFDPGAQISATCFPVGAAPCIVIAEGIVAAHVYLRAQNAASQLVILLVLQAFPQAIATEDVMMQASCVSDFGVWMLGDDLV